MSQWEQLTKEHPVEGLWKCYFRFHNAAEVINHK